MGVRMDSELIGLLSEYTAALIEVERTYKNVVELRPIVENIYKTHEDKVLIRIRNGEYSEAVTVFKIAQGKLHDKLRERG